LILKVWRIVTIIIVIIVIITIIISRIELIVTHYYFIVIIITNYFCFININQLLISGKRQLIPFLFGAWGWTVQLRAFIAWEEYPQSLWFIQSHVLNKDEDLRPNSDTFEFDWYPARSLLYTLDLERMLGDTEKAVVVPCTAHGRGITPSRSHDVMLG
jgi:hypothetical protein